MVDVEVYGKMLRRCRKTMTIRTGPVRGGRRASSTTRPTWR